MSINEGGIAAAMSSSRFQIGLCTDTHFWNTGVCQYGSNGSLQLQPCSELLLATLLSEIELFKPDLVFHLGDATCGGGYFQMPGADFYAALNCVHQEFSRLSAAAYALPGNHDCPPGGGNWSYFEQLWGLVSGTGVTIDLPMARLVLLNTQGHSREQIEAALPTDPVYGWVSDVELLRLEDALATAGSKPVLLFCHQLLRSWAGNHNPWAPHFYGIRNADAVLAIMARYGNVRAVFQGHAHRFDVHRTVVGERCCLFVVTPAVIEYPLGWLNLELTSSEAQLRLHQLPVPELAQLSRESGEGQGWRVGEPNWAELRISLR